MVLAFICLLNKQGVLSSEIPVVLEVFHAILRPIPFAAIQTFCEFFSKLLMDTFADCMTTELT